MGAGNSNDPRRERIVGSQHRAGSRKGAEGESHTDSMTHTETVCSDRFAVSYIDVLSPHTLPLTQTLRHIPQETAKEALPVPSDTSTSGFSSFLDYTLSLQCALDLGRGQLGLEPASFCPWYPRGMLNSGPSATFLDLTVPGS